jgi:hypothetical protein
LIIAKSIQSYGVKTDCFGMQEHFNLSSMPPEAKYGLSSMANYDVQVAIMKQFISPGVEVAIPKMNVNRLMPVTATNPSGYKT